MSIKGEWYSQELMQLNEERLHQPMEEEYLFYQAVCLGDMDYVRENCRQKCFSKIEGKGILSKNPLTNIKYHFIVSTALITRNCSMSGMEQEQAYRLSDFYIQKLDNCYESEDVVKLHDQMVLDFTEKMQQIKNKQSISRATTQSINYIYAHIHNRITVEELAVFAGLSPSHLERLFKKELGISISDYIRHKKIEHAKNLLQYSDYSYIDIANYLSFSSQSHFIQVFKKLVGMTPQNYRNRYHKREW